jgi:hypothetical protein
MPCMCRLTVQGKVERVNSTVGTYYMIICIEPCAAFSAMCIPISVWDAGPWNMGSVDRRGLNVEK